MNAAPDDCRCAPAVAARPGGEAGRRSLKFGSGYLLKLATAAASLS